MYFAMNIRPLRFSLTDQSGALHTCLHETTAFQPHFFALYHQMPHRNHHLPWVLQGISPILSLVVDREPAVGLGPRLGQLDHTAYRKNQGKHHRGFIRVVLFHLATESTHTAVHRGCADHRCLHDPEDSHLHAKRIGRLGHRPSAGDGQAHVVLRPAAHCCSPAGLPGGFGTNPLVPVWREVAYKKAPLVKERGIEYYLVVPSNTGLLGSRLPAE